MKRTRTLCAALTPGLFVCLYSISAFAAPVPDFMAPSVSQQKPVSLPAPKTLGQRPSEQTDLSGIPDINPAGSGLVPSSGQDPDTQTKLDNPSGAVGEFSGPTAKDTKFLNELIELRERVILDTLRQRASTIEKNLSSFEAVPPTFGRPKVVVRNRTKKSPGKAAPVPVQVLGIHEDRAFVNYQGHTKWIPVGGTIGPYILKSVTEKEAVFGDKKGHVLKVAKAARVIPRPGITVESVDNQTATIKYNGATYTVTLSSPVGTDLTVTALNQTDFSVTDAHGRVFTYPVPQKAVAPNPGGGMPYGYVPPPSPFGQQQPQQQPSAAEDSNY